MLLYRRRMSEYAELDVDFIKHIAQGPHALWYWCLKENQSPGIIYVRHCVIQCSTRLRALWSLAAHCSGCTISLLLCSASKSLPFKAALSIELQLQYTPDRLLAKLIFYKYSPAIRIEELHLYISVERSDKLVLL